MREITSNKEIDLYSRVMRETSAQLSILLTIHEDLEALPLENNLHKKKLERLNANIDLMMDSIADIRKAVTIYYNEKRAM